METEISQRVENPTVGSKEVAAERQRSIQMRQFAHAELSKQRDPNEVIKDLMAMGMDEAKAKNLVNNLLNDHSSVVQDKHEGRQSKNGITEIVLGIGLIMAGLGITWVSYDIAKTSNEGKFSVFTGLIALGIALLVYGIIKQARKNRKKDE